MELKVEAKNLEMRDNWQEKIEEEKAKLIRHYANLVLHLRVTIEATPGHKGGAMPFRWWQPSPATRWWSSARAKRYARFWWRASTFWGHS